MPSINFSLNFVSLLLIQTPYVTLLCSFMLIFNFIKSILLHTSILTFPSSVIRMLYESIIKTFSQGVSPLAFTLRKAHFQYMIYNFWSIIFYSCTKEHNKFFLLCTSKEETYYPLETVIPWLYILMLILTKIFIFQLKLFLPLLLREFCCFTDITYCLQHRKKYCLEILYLTL